MPVLLGLAHLINVTRVLELGAGQFSTPLFLNRYVFPNLTILHSLENDLLWATRITKAIRDPRLTFQL